MAFSQAFGSLLFLALSYQFGIEIRLFALTYLKLAFSTSRRTPRHILGLLHSKLLPDFQFYLRFRNSTAIITCNYPFLSRNALLARNMCCRAAVCLPVCHKPVLHQNDWTDRDDLWPEASFHCVIKKFGHPLNKFTSVWNFVPNSGPRQFCHGKSIVFSSKLVENSSTVEFVYHTYVGRCRAGIVGYYRSVDRNALTLKLHYFHL